MRSGPECWSLFWFVRPAHCQFTNCISAPRVASWRKTWCISFQSSSCALVSVGVINLATCVCIKSEEEGPVPSPVFWIWTVNPTYSTFKYWRHRVLLLHFVCTLWGTGHLLYRKKCHGLPKLQQLSFLLLEFCRSLPWCDYFVLLKT